MKETILDLGYKASQNQVQFASHYAAEIIRVMQNYDVAAIGKFIDMIDICRKKGGTIFFCGNGGKAALCSEFVNDLTVACPYSGIRAVTLMDNVTMLTAAANDYGYERALVRILKPQLQPDDMVVALSGSGQSENVIEAVLAANVFDTIKTVGIGRGGKLHAYCDLFIPIEAEDDGPTEDAIMSILHTCQAWFFRQDTP